jgi:hypothetical protein
MAELVRGPPIGTNFCSQAIGRLQQQGILALPPTIIVLDANDIVLSEIAPRLNRDQLQINFSRIFEPVMSSYGDINGFVFMDDLCFLPDGDASRAAYHDPMLSAMVVHQ